MAAAIFHLPPRRCTACGDTRIDQDRLSALSSCRGSPNSERTSARSVSGSWLETSWSACEQRPPTLPCRYMIGTLSVAFLMTEAALSHSIVDSPTRIAAETFGNKSKISKASLVECAVRTLNLPVSRTNFLTERACDGSGSATSSVGRVILNTRNALEFRLRFCTLFLEPRNQKLRLTNQFL